MCSKLVARVNFMEHFNECSTKGGSDLWVLVNCSKCGEQVLTGLRGCWSISKLIGHRLLPHAPSLACTHSSSVPPLGVQESRG